MSQSNGSSKPSFPPRQTLPPISSLFDAAVLKRQNERKTETEFNMKQNFEHIIIPNGDSHSPLAKVSPRRNTSDSSVLADAPSVVPSSKPSFSDSVTSPVPGGNLEILSSLSQNSTTKEPSVPPIEEEEQRYSPFRSVQFKNFREDSYDSVSSVASASNSVAPSAKQSLSRFALDTSRGGGHAPEQLDEAVQLLLLQGAQQRQAVSKPPVSPSARQSQNFELRVIQEPLLTRASSLHDRDRRTIDPPPVIQLFVRDNEGKTMHDESFAPFFLMHVSLWHATDDVSQNFYTDKRLGESKRSLLGTIQSTGYSLLQSNGTRGLFFIFPELYVSVEGTFRLKFDLLDLRGAIGFDHPERSSPGQLQAVTLSKQFQCFSNKNFPGVRESTDVTKWIASQGIKIPLRTEARMSRQVVSDEY